jgi:hypothetical protein
MCMTPARDDIRRILDALNALDARRARDPAGTGRRSAPRVPTRRQAIGRGGALGARVLGAGVSRATDRDRAGEAVCNTVRRVSGRLLCPGLPADPFFGR